MLDMMFVGRLRIFVSGDRNTVLIEADGQRVARFGQIGELECEAGPAAEVGMLKDLRERIADAQSDADSAATYAEEAAATLRSILDDLGEEKTRAA